MPLRERQLQLHDPAVDLEATVSVRELGVPRVETANHDVIAVEVGLELYGCRRNDRGATRR